MRSILQDPRFAFAVAVTLTAACGTAPPSPHDADADADAGLSSDALPDMGIDAAHDDGHSHGFDVTTADSGPVDAPPSALLSCEIDTAWANSSIAQWMEPTFFETSPNDGLLWAGHHDIWQAVLTRSTDGEVLAVSSARPAGALDGAWRRRVYVGQDGSILVGTTVTDGTVARVSGPPGDAAAHWLATDISWDGTRVAAAGCDADTFTLRVWEVEPTVRELATHTRDVASPCWRYENRPRVALHGESVFFVEPSTATLHHLALGTGALHGAVASEEPIDPNTAPWQASVPDFAVHPDGTLVAATGADAVLRVFRAEDMELVWEAPTHVAMLNEMTYAPPIAAAPVAWSPDGRALAALESETTLVLRDALTGDVLRTLSVEREAPEQRFGTTNAHARLTFSRDGRALYALSMWGVRAWTCDGTAPVAPDDDGSLDVVLEGPSALSAGESATFTATHLGAVEVHTHRFFVDDEPIGWGDFEREQNVHFPEPGTHTVRVELDDGVRRASASIRVEVR